MESTYGFSSLLERQFNNSRSRQFASTKPNTFYSPNNEISQMDLRDEIIKTKSTLNKRNAELHALKIAYKKLETENQSYWKVINDIISEANRNLMQQGEDVITEEEMEQCDENFIRKTGDNISQDTANKLAKQSSNQKQKTKENELREIIRKKDEEINQLINTSKISKMKELDSKYGQACAELMEERDMFLATPQMN